ncbi:MAG: hypothetical protein CMJ23_07215 [Phycisphaerae bacterium]|nr:hypothetical protein [Phycisphaerae bacterium]
MLAGMKPRHPAHRSHRAVRAVVISFDRRETEASGGSRPDPAFGPVSRRDARIRCRPVSPEPLRVRP